MYPVYSVSDGRFGVELNHYGVSDQLGFSLLGWKRLLLVLVPSRALSESRYIVYDHVCPRSVLS